MDIDQNELELVLLPGKRPSQHQLEHYLKAYECWREFWAARAESFRSSDEFTSQEEVLALYYKGECTAFCFFQKGGQTPILSQLTIHPKLRKNDQDILWKELFRTHIVNRNEVKRAG